MGWKSAKKPPNTARDVLCKCELCVDEYVMAVGWYCEPETKWLGLNRPGAVVIQWHEIPKGWKRKEIK